MFGGIIVAIVDWRISGLEFTACNCNWGCPCQFNSLPSNGHCRAGVGIHIDTGHFADVKLDGLNFGGLFAWPKAIHEGHGEALPIVDERATEAQRNAILTIMSGQESEPGATFFNVFASTLEKVHEPLFRTIAFECSPKNGTGRFSIADVVTATAEPIRNPVTGNQHRISVSLPAGFEFSEAEFASGSIRTEQSPIQLQWDQRHAHLNRLDITGKGPVRN